MHIIARAAFAAAFVALAPAAQAAVTLNSGSYSENFDGLGTANGSLVAGSLSNGWTFVETGANANTNITVSAGTANAGDTYNYGNSADRALGALASGSLVSTIGAIFTNATGQSITAISLSLFGEQWRNGGNTAAHSLTFEYLVGATALDTGNWTRVAALDVISPITGPTAGALDGNLAANRTALSATFAAALAAGQTLGIRWVDANDTGNDHGLAIDDVTLRATFAAGAVPEPATWAMMIAGFGVAGAALRRRRALAVA